MNGTEVLTRLLEANVSLGDLHTIWGAVRGPDARGDVAETVKSVTALLVRRALYGVERAMTLSDPDQPMIEAFKLLKPKDITTMPWHYREHAVRALRLLDGYNLFANAEDQALSYVVRDRIHGD